MATQKACDVSPHLLAAVKLKFERRWARQLGRVVFFMLITYKARGNRTVHAFHQCDQSSDKLGTLWRPRVRSIPSSESTVAPKSFHIKVTTKAAFTLTSLAGALFEASAFAMSKRDGNSGEPI